LNSFKNIERAIYYEIARQIDLVSSGGSIVQQTMHFDPASGKTSAMREKEEANDYRYFPDPDLKPLLISAERIAEASKSLPELPEQLANRFIKEYKLTEYDATNLTFEKDLAAYFEQVVECTGKKVTPKVVANWVLGEFLKEANERDWDFSNPCINKKKFAKLLDLIGEGTISIKIAKTVFAQMAESGDDPESIVKDKGLVQISDTGEIERVIEAVIARSESQVAEYRSGKERVFGYFVGQIMKDSGGKMNPALVNKILKDKLK